MIPPKFRPANCCAACNYFKGSYCLKHNYPTTGVMVCDDFTGD